MEQKLDASTAEYIKGPEIVEWLQAQGIDLTEAVQGPAVARRVNEWKRGALANFYTVDNLLTNTGLSVWDIPEDLFVVKPKRRCARPQWRVDEEIKQKAIEDAKQMRKCDVAKKYGITARALHTWIQQTEAA